MREISTKSLFSVLLGSHQPRGWKDTPLTRRLGKHFTSCPPDPIPSRHTPRQAFDSLMLQRNRRRLLPFYYFFFFTFLPSSFHDLSLSSVLSLPASFDLFLSLLSSGSDSSLLFVPFLQTFISPFTTFSFFNSFLPYFKFLVILFSLPFSSLPCLH